MALSKAWAVLLSGALLLVINLRLFYLHPLHLDVRQPPASLPTKATSEAGAADLAPAVAAAESATTKDGGHIARKGGRDIEPHSRTAVTGDPASHREPLQNAAIASTMNSTQTLAPLMREQALHATQVCG
jgi:hypothetical protein